MDRRDFFKKGIFKMVGQALHKTEELYDTVKESVQSQMDIIDTGGSKKTEEEISEKKEQSIEIPEVIKPRKKIRGLSFPPGALKVKEKFLSKCTGCGECINACPYGALFPVFDSKLEKDIPHMDTNASPCLMCKDYPCISSCTYGALKPYKKKESPKFGQAKLIFENCINYESEDQKCDQCALSCPIESVVSFNRKFKPLFSKSCTGCGICIQSCPPFPKAIVVKF